ncbi:hypothetical protein MAXJ12_34964 [Mesorhizobium alhagi CCNWXJ12-2]|uniref:Uncharacterized protein n=1 Tax=Mesorhizobium alhagi CCNWXJ12-2 TaxID=1107882 RepID=H0I3C8_9HYPH|nr:hypothetical protein MAXJ12_34964 [Mesorhizobium alhagi CCNWXJ12-2]
MAILLHLEPAHAQGYLAIAISLYRKGRLFSGEGECSQSPADGPSIGLPVELDRSLQGRQLPDE